MVKESNKFLPTDFSITSILAIGIMEELYSDENPSHGVIGPFPFTMDESRTFDHVLLNWLDLSQNMANLKIEGHFQFLIHMYVFLCQSPTQAMCEHLVVSKYSYLKSSYKGRSVWDQESSEAIDVIDYWSETISTCFGFTPESMADKTHSINQAMFTTMDQFKIELPLFNSKIHYLANIDSSQLSEIMTKYLTKFIKSSVHYFKEAGRNKYSLQQNDIAAILQAFVKQSVNGPPIGPPPVKGSIFSSNCTFGVTQDIPGIYNHDIIKTLLPLLLVVESSFQVLNKGDPPVHRKIEGMSIHNAEVRVQNPDPDFYHCYYTLINHGPSMENSQIDAMLKTYIDLVDSVVPKTIQWKVNPSKRSRVSKSNLVYQEHMYYWAHLTRLLDLRKDSISRKVREKYCPHYLLPIYYSDITSGSPDNRAALILEAIERMRKGLRNATQESQTLYSLRQALTYLAPKSPGDSFAQMEKNNKKQAGEKSSTEELAEKKQKSKQMIEKTGPDKTNYRERPVESSPVLPENLFLTEKQDFTWNYIVTPGLSNPTRSLALQCLRKANYLPYFLDWSIFLMLSTISYHDKAKQYKEDVEISLNSINLSLSELLIGESDHPPNIEIKDLKPLMESFLEMLEDPYNELGHRFNFEGDHETLSRAIESSRGYSKHKREHPTIKSEIDQPANKYVKMYFEAMKHAFLEEYSQFVPGSDLDVALEEE